MLYDLKKEKSADDEYREKGTKGKYDESALTHFARLSADQRARLGTVGSWRFLHIRFLSPVNLRMYEFISESDKREAVISSSLFYTGCVIIWGLLCFIPCVGAFILLLPRVK
jgi:hypothetical protein